MKPESRGTLQRVGWLLAELLVVFAGVFGAFMLEGCREDRAEERRRQQILTALQQEFDLIASELRQATIFLDSAYVDPFITAYDAGDMPRPVVLSGGTGVINTGTWEAMLASGGIDVLEVGLIQDVSVFYTQTQFLISRLEEFSDLTNQYLLPVLDADLGQFYDSNTRRIRPAYQWYVDLMRNITQHVERLAAFAERLARDVEDRREST